MFSENYNYKTEKPLLLESVSASLRNRIWNMFYQNEIYSKGIEATLYPLNGKIPIENRIVDKLGIPLDPSKDSYRDDIRDYIINKWNWFEVYDFVEIHISVINDDEKQDRIKQYNNLFEEENSGYRIVNGEVTPITNKTEIDTIEKSITSPYSPVNEHIKKSLSLYSDLENPDYENSIKESISAVESICCIIKGESGSNATLGKTIKKLKDSGIHIHPAMENAFSSLYGYTSDENGIRHGGIDFSNAPAEDAKFMLVACSAFVNYLIEKMGKIDDMD
jgi:hypothetical protein